MQEAETSTTEDEATGKTAPQQPPAAPSEKTDEHTNNRPSMTRIT